MNYQRFTRVLLPLLLLALLAVAPIPASAQTKGKVDAAREAEEEAFAKLRVADAALDDALHELERIEGNIYSLNWRIDKLGVAVVEYQGNVTDLNERAKALVLDAYTSGGRNLVTSAFSAESIQELITSQALFDAATTRDLNQLDQLAAVSRQCCRKQRQNSTMKRKQNMQRRIARTKQSLPDRQQQQRLERLAAPEESRIKPGMCRVPLRAIPTSSTRGDTHAPVVAPTKAPI